jgi:hypothetical protein
MPQILIGEIIQVSIYIGFGIFITLTKFKKPLYFSLGFVIALAIPSILVGYGVPGMRGVSQIGNSAYEIFRSLPIANGIWGIFHLILAVTIYSKIRDDYTPGFNINTLLIAIGFCFVYVPLSIFLGLK